MAFLLFLLPKLSVEAEQRQQIVPRATSLRLRGPPHLDDPSCDRVAVTAASDRAAARDAHNIASSDLCESGPSERRVACSLWINSMEQRYFATNRTKSCPNRSLQFHRQGESFAAQNAIVIEGLMQAIMPLYDFLLALRQSLFVALTFPPYALADDKIPARSPRPKSNLCYSRCPTRRYAMNKLTRQRGLPSPNENALACQIVLCFISGPQNIGAGKYGKESETT